MFPWFLKAKVDQMKSFRSKLNAIKYGIIYKRFYKCVNSGLIVVDKSINVYVSKKSPHMYHTDSS